MSDGHTEAMRGTYFSEKKPIPTHDPQTGELNPYYKELTGKENPMGEYNKVDTKKEKNDIMLNQYSEFKQAYVPDPKMHQFVSFAKSTVRIAGYILIPFNLESAAIVLILSEVIGIVEELV